MASDSLAQSLPSYTHIHMGAHTHTHTVTQWAQWEVPAKRVAIMLKSADLFSRDLQQFESTRAFFSPLYHNTMDMLICSLNTRQKLQNGLFALCCDLALNFATH